MSIGVGLGVGIGVAALAAGVRVPFGYLALRYKDADGNYRPIFYQTALGAHLPLAYLKAA